MRKQSPEINCLIYQMNIVGSNRLKRAKDLVILEHAGALTTFLLSPWRSVILGDKRGGWADDTPGGSLMKGEVGLKQGRSFKSR